MPLTTFLAFIFLSCSFLSVWFKRDPKIWGGSLGLCLFFGLVAGNITWLGLSFIFLLSTLWFFYARKPNVLIFVALVCLSISFKLRFIPGYDPFFITPKFAVGLENPLIGLFPLTLLVPLAKGWKGWMAVAKGAVFGCVGIAILASIAMLSGAAQWNFTLPSYFGAR